MCKFCFTYITQICIHFSFIRIHPLSFRKAKFPIVQRTRCTCYLKLFILFSDGLSVHHQELKTAYTATVYVKQLLLPTAIGDEMELQALRYKPEGHGFDSRWCH